MIEEYGFDEYFSFQVYSDEVGLSKPNLKIFELIHDYVNEQKSLHPKQILHIGDNIIADYNGARSYGFSALLLNYES